MCHNVKQILFSAILGGPYIFRLGLSCISVIFSSTSIYVSIVEAIQKVFFCYRENGEVYANANVAG